MGVALCACWFLVCHGLTAAIVPADQGTALPGYISPTTGWSADFATYNPTTNRNVNPPRFKVEHVASVFYAYGERCEAAKVQSTVPQWRVISSGDTNNPNQWKLGSTWYEDTGTAAPWDFVAYETKPPRFARWRQTFTPAIVTNEVFEGFPEFGVETNQSWKPTRTAIVFDYAGDLAEYPVAITNNARDYLYNLDGTTNRFGGGDAYFPLFSVTNLDQLSAAKWNVWPDFAPADSVGLRLDTYGVQWEAGLLDLLTHYVDTNVVPGGDWDAFFADSHAWRWVCTHAAFTYWENLRRTAPWDAFEYQHPWQPWDVILYEGTGDENPPWADDFGPDVGGDGYFNDVGYWTTNGAPPREGPVMLTPSNLWRYAKLPGICERRVVVTNYADAVEGWRRGQLSTYSVATPEPTLETNVVGRYGFTMFDHTNGTEVTIARVEWVPDHVQSAILSNFVLAVSTNADGTWNMDTNTLNGVYTWNPATSNLEHGAAFITKTNALNPGAYTLSMASGPRAGPLFYGLEGLAGGWALIATDGAPHRAGASYLENLVVTTRVIRPRSLDGTFIPPAQWKTGLVYFAAWSGSTYAATWDFVALGTAWTPDGNGSQLVGPASNNWTVTVNTNAPVTLAGTLNPVWFNFEDIRPAASMDPSAFVHHFTSNRPDANGPLGVSMEVRVPGPFTEFSLDGGTFANWVRFHEWFRVLSSLKMTARTYNQRLSIPNGNRGARAVTPTTYFWNPMSQDLVPGIYFESRIDESDDVKTNTVFDQGWQGYNHPQMSWETNQSFGTGCDGTPYFFASGEGSDFTQIGLTTDFPKEWHVQSFVPPLMDARVFYNWFESARTIDTVNADEDCISDFHTVDGTKRESRSLYFTQPTWTKLHADGFTPRLAASARVFVKWNMWPQRRIEFAADPWVFNDWGYTNGAIVSAIVTPMGNCTSPVVTYVSTESGNVLFGPSDIPRAALHPYARGLKEFPAAAFTKAVGQRTVTTAQFDWLDGEAVDPLAWSYVTERRQWNFTTHYSCVTDTGSTTTDETESLYEEDRVMLPSMATDWYLENAAAVLSWEFNY